MTTEMTLALPPAFMQKLGELRIATREDRTEPVELTPRGLLDENREWTLQEKQNLYGLLNQELGITVRMVRDALEARPANSPDPVLLAESPRYPGLGLLVSHPRSKQSFILSIGYIK